MTDDGLITRPSAHPVGDTVDRLDRAVRQKGITVFARVDHAAGAAAAGMALRPTELLVFGNPQAGTPLMQARQTMGLDLPLKALAWEDEAGHVWLTVDDLTFIARRHGLDTGAQPALARLAAVLADVAERACA